MDALVNATVIITGAASGIGKGAALAVARRGSNVVVADIDDAGSATTVSQIKDLGANAVAVHTDVADVSAFEELREAALRSYGSVDVVMNNAGVLTRGAPEDIDGSSKLRV
ncbi:SDR family NAD(P)-dependent oxidoreductase [Microbacterium sp. PRC9]|uniref:SDR family NAD(P)-dependent oxidoreductase n=1 Tax=Microbacterium sp. PRC9 TaxID=2962591 RepID=UPI00288184EA|nr:SDR family NAD(P)-dependent oxidoreductase [Microbacterium sp. PRC9]MDT0144545.1 SDR family NAD(P)-dependent oxidoreductase [Microbacterium sp. PRC9]